MSLAERALRALNLQQVWLMVSPGILLSLVKNGLI
ncbi:hypothetical protein FAI40_06215 [Acetobacteraceae bacterium]|nr:hypothetical protein FAI40_06215 [Acetobacteraceae bacterium]